MKTIRYASLVTIAAASFATSAYAQSEEKPWQGGYIGATVGYSVQKNDRGENVVFDNNLDGTYTDTVRTSAAGNPDAFSPGFCNGAATGTANRDCTNDKDDIDYHIRAGYDWQSGHFVYGALIEGGTSKATDSVTAFSTTPAFYSFTRKLDYSVDARLRGGYALGDGLFYATGGVSYAKIKNSFRTSNTANSFTDNGNSNSLGYSFGGGAEVKLARNFSMGLEYLYTNYTKDKYVVSVGPGTAPPTNPFLRVNPAGTNMKRGDSDFDMHSLRLTAAFRF